MRATDASKKALYFVPRRPINPLISPENIRPSDSAGGTVQTHGPSLRPLAAWVAPVGAPGACQAASYSAQPTTILVHFGNGTTADLIATGRRALPKHPPKSRRRTQARRGRRPRRWSRSRRVRPTRTTLVMITQGTHVFNLSRYKTLRYDPRAIIRITPISAVSNVMTGSPIQSREHAAGR